MKKILSFLLLGMLCSIGNLWAAASSVIPSSPSYKDISAAVTDNEYVFECLSSSITSTANATSSWIGWYSTQSSFKEYDKSGSAVCMGSQKKIPNLKYDKVYFYVTKCDSFQIQAWANGSSRTLNYSYQAAGEDAVEGSFTESSNTDCAHSDFISLDKTKNYTIIVWNNNSEEIGVTYMVFKTAVIACTEPATPLTLSSNAAATVYVGDEITFSTTGGNGSTVTIAGSSSETISANVWTATVGTHTFTASQAANIVDEVLYCAQESELEITVLEQNPVTAVVVEGTETAYKGNAVSYTATAANATEYRWKVNGAIQAGATANEFVYTPTVNGTYSIVCEARNEFNATDEWIASSPISLVVTSLYGELIKATLNGGNSATMTGIIGGTFDTNLGSGKYKLDKNKYIGVILANTSFQEGDTVIITMTTAGANYPCLFADKERANVLFLATEGSTELEYKIVLPAAANGLTTLYLSRGGDETGDDVKYKWNPVVASISVVRPMPEKSRVAVLTGAKINGVALAAEDVTTLTSTHSFASISEFAEAPVVKFYTSVTITYEDDSQKVINDSIVVTAVENGDLWQAQAEISAEAYTITAVHPVSFTVSYKYGETLLGEEAVIAGDKPANYATHESMQLATFDGWYSDAELTDEVTMANAEIIQDTTFYAKYTLHYATSINIEKYALRSGKDSVKTVQLLAQMGSQKYASNFAYTSGNCEIDYLDDDKDARNYSYLGLKVKNGGTMFDFRLAKDNTVKVKFGAIKSTKPQVSINGNAYAEMTITSNVYSYTATEDSYISIKTADANAVVLKQIAIGEELEDSEYEVTLTLGEGGYSTFATDYKYTVSNNATVYQAAVNGAKDAVVLTEVADAVVPANAGIILKGTAGATVTLTASGSTASTLTGNQLVGVVEATAAPANAYVISTNEGVTAFNPCQTALLIPAHKAYLVIEGAQAGAPVRVLFAENNTTDINAIEASEKAQKFFENGKLYILREGVVYDATGRIVR